MGTKWIRLRRAQTAMYGLAGERRLGEWEIPWLSGYEGAKRSEICPNRGIVMKESTDAARTAVSTKSRGTLSVPTA